MKTIIVVPTIRPNEIIKFLQLWKDEFKNHNIMIVEDNSTKTFEIKQDNVIHFCHKDIDSDLGDKSWIINRKDPSVFSYGIYKAYQENPDMIVVLSDDCLPLNNNFLKTHWKKLNLKVSTTWLNPLWNIYPRGFPYRKRDNEVVFNMGLWQGIPDVDSITQFAGYSTEYQKPNLVIPKETYFALCSMNIAFKPKATPFMYEFARDRYDDIWMGIRAKREFDKRNWAMTLGSPLILHTRASNPYINLQKESIFLEENETFYEKPIPKEYQKKIDIWMGLFDKNYEK